MAPSHSLRSPLSKRQWFLGNSCTEYNPDGTCKTYDISNDWVRWVIVAVVLAIFLLLFVACSCISVRRRRKQGQAPHWGTAWADRNRRGRRNHYPRDPHVAHQNGYAGYMGNQGGGGTYPSQTHGRPTYIGHDESFYGPWGNGGARNNATGAPHHQQQDWQPAPPYSAKPTGPLPPVYSGPSAESRDNSPEGRTPSSPQGLRHGDEGGIELQRPGQTYQRPSNKAVTQ